eukprot:COSAG01_NODE_2549_length_7465_cov_5.036383_2_plen_54_part_00
MVAADLHASVGHTELHNVYLHCLGCQKDEYDFNVCTDCFKVRHVWLPCFDIGK